MNLSLKGKRAIVCGSTQGIGKAIAIKLALQGAAITLISRDEKKLQVTLKELKLINKNDHNFIVSDFNDLKLLKTKFKDFLKLNLNPTILINNTGGPPPGPISKASSDDFEKYMKMHLHCSHYLSTSLIPIMKEKKFGRIINIISTSVKAPIPGLGVSNTIRAAVANWAKTLSLELGSYGITVNNVLPGFTNTNRLKSLIEKKSSILGKSKIEVENEMKKSVPLNRFGEASEVANAAIFLSSPAASYINGINLPVDGGRTSSL